MAAYQRSLTQFIPVYTASPRAVMKAISKDFKMQIDGLSATARKIDEVHFSLEKESKETLYDVCPRCKEKVNKYNITQYLDVECQTENNENPLTKALLDGLNGRLTFRLCVPEESGSDLEQWCLTPYLSTGCERQGTGRILHTHFTDDSSTQQCNELKQAVESEKETTSPYVNAVTDSLKEIFPKLPKEIQELEDKIESKDKELRKLKEKNNTLKKEVEALQSVRKILCKENETLKDTEELKEGNRYTLQSEVAKKKEALQNLQNRLEQEMFTIGERDRMIQQLKQDHQIQKTCYEEDIRRLEEANKTLPKTNRDLDGALGFTKEQMERMSFVKTGQTTEQLDSIQKGESCLQLDLNGQKETKDENNKRSDRNISQDTGDDQLRLLKIEKENITSEIKLLQEKYEQLQKSLQNLEQDSERKQKDHEQQRKDLRSHITTLTSTNSVLQGEVDMKNRQIETLEKETKTLKNEKNNLTSDLDKYDEENKGLTRNFETLHREKTNLMSDLKKHETEKERLTMRVKAIEGENETLQDDLERLQTESRRDLNSLSCNIEELKHKICEKEEEIQHMNEEINELRKPAKTDIVLGVRYGNSIGKTMIDMVTKELSKRLELMIDMTKFSLAVKLYHKCSDIPKGPLVVVCLGISSVGANIQGTLVGIEVGSDVTVLVLHNINKENLSSLTPTSLRVTGKEFRKLGAIVDMAFSSESGLYECDLNTTAIVKMAAVLTKC